MNLPPPNQFLQSLSKGDFALLAPHLRDVKLAHAQVLFDQGGVIQHLYFPYSGVISFVVPLSDGVFVEAGMIGRDGVVGTPAALDGAKSLNQAVVQVPSEAFIIDTPHAKAAVTASRTLREKFYQNDQLLLVQAQQSAACNAAHAVEERLCRWILRTRDVAGDDNLELTQSSFPRCSGSAEQA